MRSSTLVLAVLVIAVASTASAQTITPATSGVVPVVSRTPGAMGSTWSTNVYLTQIAGTAPATVKLDVHMADGTVASMEMTIPGAGGSVEVTDVVTAAGVTVDGNYVMTWWSTQPVVLSTRTFTTEDTGSYGQGIGSMAEGSGFASGGTVIFPAPMDAGSHRVNVGIANAGGTTQTFHLEAIDSSGGVVSTWDEDVAPYAITQLRTNNGMDGAGSVTLRCDSGCDGNAYGYASVVVNDSNDAYFLYAGAGEGTTQYAPVMTVRNDEGVWFITGGSFYDVFEAQGYAVASDRLWQLETLRRSGRGTMAEIFGIDFLEDDVTVRTATYSEGELQAQFASFTGDTKVMFQGYADGINRRIAEVVADPTQLPFEFLAVGQQLGVDFVPAEWTPTDLLAVITVIQRNFDGEATDSGQPDNAALLQTLAAAYPDEYTAMFTDLRWLDDPSALTVIPGEAGKAATSVPHGANVTGLPDMREAAKHIRQRWQKLDRDLERINAAVHFGSYAWVVSGDKTASGNPILYSGPQMGFSVPSIVGEGSIVGGGLTISGMFVPGFPGIIIGRTPHHVWSMMTGHAHTLDYYLESPVNVELHRLETIKVAGIPDQTLPVYRSSHGPIVEPVPYDPQNPPAVIVSYAYAHWGIEHLTFEHWSDLASATSVEAFGQALEGISSSFHFGYADRDGNIAYWMTGRNPVRPAGVDPRLPLLGDGTQEWTGSFVPMPHAENPDQGFFCGWNNKTAADYPPGTNNPEYYFGPYHRAYLIRNYLADHDDLTYEEIRDLAINIGTTESFGRGGDALAFVEDRFRAAVNADPTPERTAAMNQIDAWDRHFVAGGESQWVAGTVRDDAWALQDVWIYELLDLVFGDEFDGAGLDWEDVFPGSLKAVLFNVLVHALEGDQASVPALYDWFQDRAGSGNPTTADELIVLALDNVIAGLGPQPWNFDREVISFRHDLLGEVHTAPYSNRHTYNHVVEMGEEGPIRIESMFPLGESGTILMDGQGNPVFDPNFFSMAPYWDAFAPRPFALFE